MVIRYLYSILVIIVFFNFMGCVSNKKLKQEIDSLNKKLESMESKLAQFDPAVILKKETQEKTLERILIDTDDPQLAAFIKKSEAEKKKLRKQLNEARKKNKAQECLNLEREIDGIVARQYGEIDKKYRRIRVDFKDLNVVNIPPEEKFKLEACKADFEEKCRANRKILIYGYGCYIGEEEQIKKVTEDRAKNVATWIKGETKCSSDANFDCKGVGIFLKRDYVNFFGEALKKQLLSESRHVEIFIPL